MATPALMLERIGQALLSSGAGDSGRVDLGLLVRDLWGVWARDRKPAERQADLQALRHVSADELQAALVELVRTRFAGSAPPPLLCYLSVLPALLRHHPDRPVENFTDLQAWMPGRLPLFTVGGQPAGVGDRELIDPFAITDAAECWLARNPHMPARPPALLAFFPDPDERPQQLLAWHLQAAGPGVLPVEHTYLNAEVPCLQFATPPALRFDALPAKAARAPALLREIVSAVARLHAHSPPLVAGTLAPGRILLQPGDAPAPQILVLEAPGHDQPREDVRQLGLLLPADDSRFTALRSACLAPDPAQRPPDATALLERLKSVPDAEPAAEGSRLSARARRGADLWTKLRPLEKEGPEMPKVITNGAGMRFVLVPAGAFVMGSPPTETGRRDNEGPQHEVILTRPFYLAVHPVTQEQYLAVTGKNPSRFQGAAGGGPDHPVECVNWDEAAAFCEALNGRKDEQEAGRTYRLPTEAEWEYACRAGTTSPFAFGDSLGINQASFDGNHPYGEGARGPSPPRTVRAGSFPDNHFGLYDMHGNVWEWCADWFDAGYYAVSSRQDPQGPDTGTYRVLRGGSWRNQAVTCRSAYRNALAPNQRQPFIGFRVVLTWTPPPAKG